MPRIKREKGKGKKEEEAAKPMPETAQPPAQDEEDSPVPAAERIPVDVDPHDLDIESDPTSDSESSIASGNSFLCVHDEILMLLSVNVRARGLKRGGWGPNMSILSSLLVKVGSPLFQKVPLIFSLLCEGIFIILLR